MDCLLVFDETTQRYRLERVDSCFNFQHDRKSKQDRMKNSPAIAPVSNDPSPAPMKLDEDSDEFDLAFESAIDEVDSITYLG